MTECLYRWAGSGAFGRTDSPSVADLLLDGWTVEYVDQQNGSMLMRKEMSSGDGAEPTPEKPRQSAEG